MRVHRLVLVPIVLLSLVACGDDGPDTASAASTEPAPSALVEIDRSRFSELELTVAAGSTVTFVNNDAAAHTVTARDDSPVPFDSGELRQGDTFDVVFDQPGEYRYFCRIHPTMRATVIVT